MKMMKMKMKMRMKRRRASDCDKILGRSSIQKVRKGVMI
jgi:hypothetical protein